jgi:hypothetical protein
MKVGFTGTQVGMTEYQEIALVHILRREGALELHHGNCIGADEQACQIAWDMDIPPIAHPGDTPEKQSEIESFETLPVKPNLERNHDIVDVCELLVAAPKGPPQQRSGTWATIRYADKVGRKTLIITPNGEII